MTATSYERLLKACDNFGSYPTNLEEPGNPPHSLKHYRERLAKQRRLFKEDGKASLQFLDFGNTQEGIMAPLSKSMTPHFMSDVYDPPFPDPVPVPATSLLDLRSRLRYKQQPVESDPQCRFM